MIADALARLLGVRSAATLDRLDPRDPAIAKLLGVGNNTLSKTVVDGETVLGIPAMFRGISILSNALMKAKPAIYRRAIDGSNDRERDKDHPSWKVVTRRANEFMSDGQLRKTLTAWAIERGNGLAWIQRDGAQRVVEMIPLPPDRSGMAIFRRGQKLEGDAELQPGDLVRYWTMVGGQAKMLPPGNVIHIKGLSGNGLWGYDIISILREQLGGCLAARDYSTRFYGQGAMISGIIFMPPGLEEEQQKNFAEAVKKGSESLGRAHRLMVLDGQSTHVPLSVDPEKAALIGTMQAQRIDIANIVGVQGHKVGDSSRVAYNSLEQSNQEHLDDDLDPWLQTWEDELNDKCLSEDEKASDSHFIEFNRTALVRVNLDARTKREQFERTYGIATGNDILRRSNGKPIGPVGDTYMVPANMTVLDKDGLPIIRGQAAPEPAPRERPPPADEPEDDDRAEQFAELAMHEIERLATRACREAGEAARQGAAKFAEWLDRLPTWPRKPSAIAPLIGATLAHIHGELDAFTLPPYGAADLAANVARHIEAIQAGAVVQAREHLEAAR